LQDKNLQENRFLQWILDALKKCSEEQQEPGNAQDPESLSGKPGKIAEFKQNRKQANE
jgi:hypothetical protein